MPSVQMRRVTVSKPVITEQCAFLNPQSAVYSNDASSSDSGLARVIGLSETAVSATFTVHSRWRRKARSGPRSPSCESVLRISRSAST